VPENLDVVMSYLDMKSLFNLNISSIIKQFADGMDTLNDRESTALMKKRGFLETAELIHDILYLFFITHMCTNPTY
jgi:hypothetical protein